MIVKNEAIMLRECLESIKDLADQIVIVDSGSTDDTVNIAKEYTEHVFHRDWTDSFCDARIDVESRSKKIKPTDYICRWDGDWVLKKGDQKKLLELKANGFKDMDRVDISFSENFDDSDPLDTRPISTTSLFLIYKQGLFHWESAIHNQLIWNDCNTKPKVLNLPQIIAFHYRIKAQKDWRLAQTVLILEKEIALNPDNDRMQFFLAREEFLKNQFDLALPRYQKILKTNLDPDFQSYILEKIVMCLLSLQDYTAINNYKEILNKNKNPRTTLLQADISILSNIEKAAQLYLRFVSMDFSAAETQFEFDSERYLTHPLIQLAKIHILNKQPKKALEYLQKAELNNNLPEIKNKIILLKSYC